MLCVLNSHGSEKRSADVLVDEGLNLPEGKGRVTVILNSAEEAAKSNKYSGNYRTRSKVPVKRAGDMAYVDIWDLAPSEVLVLAAHPEIGGGGGGVRGFLYKTD